MNKGIILIFVFAFSLNFVSATEYQVVGENMDWYQTVVLCEEFGPGWHIITVDDATEQAFIWDTYGGPDIWTGLRDVDGDGIYEDDEWEFGSSSFRNWWGGYGGTPNQCALMYRNADGRWIEGPCTNTQEIVSLCELGSDFFAPTITNIQDSPDPVFSGNVITLSASVVDDFTIDVVAAEVDGLLVYLMDNVEGDTFQILLDTQNLSLGVHSYKIIANDTSNNVAESETNLFTVVAFGDTDFAITSDGIILSDNNVLRETPITITAIFENLLSEDPSEILVRFYNDDPLIGELIGEHLVNIAGNPITSTFIAQIEWTPNVEGNYNIHVVLDPENLIIEPDETNNVANKTLTIITIPDLRIRDQDIFFTDNNPIAGEVIQILAMVRNIETQATGEFVVRFYDNFMGNVLGEVSLSLNGLETQVVSIPWETTAGDHEIHVLADKFDVIEEWDETNNEGIRDITVRRRFGSSPSFLKNPPVRIIAP